MTKKGINKKAVLGAVVFLVVIVVAAVFIQKWTEEGRRKDGWVKEYLWEANRYGADYAALPTEVLPWEEWYQTVMDGPKLTDGDVLPENRLGTLMHTYVSLSTIHLKEPDNAECQALFEKLRPYYEKAFVWEQEPGTEECLERLEERRFRLLPYEAVGVSGGLLLCFRADRVSVDGRELGPMTVALSPTPVSGGGCTALWGGERGERCAA